MLIWLGMGLVLLALLAGLLWWARVADRVEADSDAVAGTERKPYGRTWLDILSGRGQDRP